MSGGGIDWYYIRVHTHIILHRVTLAQRRFIGVIYLSQLSDV